MTQGFVPRFPPPEGNKPHHLPHHRAGVSTGGRLVLLLPKSAGIAKRLPWLDVMHVKTIILYIYDYICRQFGTILDALEDNSFMIFYAHSGMNERNSSLEVFLRIWHNLTVKHRDLKEKNCRWQKRDTETQLMNPQFDAIGPPVITCDPKTWLWHALDDQPSNASLVRNPGDCSPRGDPSGWPGWSQPPEIATCHIYTSDSRAVAFILHWMWCQTQFPRHHRSAHCVRNRIITRKTKDMIKININSNIEINIEFDSGLTHKGCRGNSKSICAPQIRLSR